MNNEAGDGTPGESSDTTDWMPHALGAIQSANNTFMALFTGLIAGSIYILLEKAISDWAISLMSAGILLFLLGIGCTVIYQLTLAQLFSIFWAMSREKDQQRLKSLARSEGKKRRTSDMVHLGQITFLLFGLLLSSLGIAIHLGNSPWKTLGLSGLGLLLSAFVVRELLNRQARLRNNDNL